ncbi:MAG: hypothetical protein U0232_13470 [Thermomicrobiales bacterium]
MYCGQCGEKAFPDQRYCSACGAALQQAPQPIPVGGGVAIAQRETMPRVEWFRRVILAAMAIVTLLIVVLIVSWGISFARQSSASVPDGYVLWQGLPIPDYFGKDMEYPVDRNYNAQGTQPRDCTQAWFNHGLDDYQLVQKQLASVWAKRGITYSGNPIPLVGDAYQSFARKEGGTIAVIWHGKDSPLFVLGKVEIISCPP